MITFLLGLLLGGISGGGTYALTTDSHLALVVGGVVTIACWLGVAAVIFIDE
ncbi:hypothetical protein ACGFWI_01090 [Streptomyces sp. NPDC048434]|uniref:hypothetical protein n=1 Tax=Streptomyces sp. NPDC048434 TaxID=3365549 RepID=UPI00370F8AD8